MARILRGDIWWATLDPVRGHAQAGTRPVLILSHDVFNQRSGTVIAVAITIQMPSAGFPLTYRLPDDTLTKRAWVKISQIRTLSTERLTNRVGAISLEDLEEILDGLYEIIGN